MLVPRPGCSVVKLAPISVETDIMGINGQKIVKSTDAIDMELAKQNQATVVMIGPPREDEKIWFAKGDTILLSRLGGHEFTLHDGKTVHQFWLIPNECVLGVFRDE